MLRLTYLSGGIYLVAASILPRRNEAPARPIASAMSLPPFAKWHEMREKGIKPHGDDALAAAAVTS